MNKPVVPVIVPPVTAPDPIVTPFVPAPAAPAVKTPPVAAKGDDALMSQAPKAS